MKRLKILTWHVHGSYLYYLSHIPHDIYLPVNANRSLGYCGRTPSYRWPENVHEVPAAAVSKLKLDCILFQAPTQYFEDQHDLLSADQQKLPKLYLEHDPPRGVPTDTPHWVNDPNVLLIHVTAFNDLMWDSGRTPTRVIDHGVVAPDNVKYNGTLARGAVVVNNIKSRGRRLGYDIYLQARKVVPLDLVGMGWQEAEGAGELTQDELFEFMADRRFFFHPIRYTSLGLALLEAMSIGCPVVGLATTELPTIIKNGINGYISTRPSELVDHMLRLNRNPKEAYELGREARRTALSRFTIDRFVRDWNSALAEATGTALRGHRKSSTLPDLLQSPE